MMSASEPSHEVRVRPAWLRPRVVVAAAVILVAGLLLALNLLLPRATLPDHPRAALNQVRACATATEPDALAFCVPDLAEARETARLALGGEPSPETVDQAVAQAAREEALRRLPELERDVAAAEQPAARAWFRVRMFPAMLTSILLSPYTLLAVTIGLVYGLASLWMAGRRFRVTLDATHLGIGPPTGLERHALGDLREVSIEQGRLVMWPWHGPPKRSVRLGVTPALRDLVEAANRAIEAVPEDARVRVMQAPDTVVLVQRPGRALRGLARATSVLGTLGVLALLVAAPISYGLARSLVPDEGSAIGVHKTALQACGRGQRATRCLALEPEILHDVPAPHVYRRWIEQELTRAAMRGEELPQVASPLLFRLGNEGEAEAWLDSLRPIGREIDAGYIWADVQSPRGALGKEIQVRATGASSALQGQFTKAWSEPGVVAAWERLRLRDRQLREGIPWLWLLDDGLAGGALFLVLLTMAVVPPVQRRRRTARIEVTPTGVVLGGTRVPFSEIASIELVRRRIVVRTRGGSELRTGRLAHEGAAEPVLEAVGSCILDEDALADEHDAARRARTELAAARPLTGR